MAGGEGVLKFSPYGKMILLERVWISNDQQYPKTTLIEIPETVRQQLTPFARVLAVGKKTDEGLAPGDKVMFNPYRACTMETNAAEKIALVHERHVQAVLPGFPDHAMVVQEEAREVVAGQGFV
jgi:co-chaperonin GroES (HSP10)